MIESKFQAGNKVVYPAHGVGKITGVETQIISGHELTAYVVKFEKEKMTLRIPVKKALSSGLRELCSINELDRMHRTLKSRARTSRGMWSRRAKEYEDKINSGNIVSLAEVVRDLHKNVDDPDRSYSERVIYENALNRLAGEVSAVQEIDLVEASSLLVKTINDNLPKEDVVATIEEVKTVVSIDIENDFNDLENNFEENVAA